MDWVRKIPKQCPAFTPLKQALSLTLSRNKTHNIFVCSLCPQRQIAKSSKSPNKTHALERNSSIACCLNSAGVRSICILDLTNTQWHQKVTTLNNCHPYASGFKSYGLGRCEHKYVGGSAFDSPGCVIESKHVLLRAVSIRATGGWD